MVKQTSFLSNKVKKNTKVINLIKNSIEVDYLNTNQVDLEVGNGFSDPPNDPGKCMSYSLCTMAQGDGTSTYNAAKITPKSLRIRGHVQHGASASHGTIRLLVVRKIATNGAAPTAADLFADNSGTNNKDVYSARNRNAMKQFNVLYDKTFQLMASSAAGRKNVDISLKLAPKQIAYDNATAAVSSIKSNGLFFFAIGNDNDAVNDKTPLLTFNAELRYSDL